MRGDSTQYDQTQLCEYHRDMIHKMNHCRNLKYLVENLIKAGCFKEFIKHPQHGNQSSGPSNTPTTTNDVPSVINVIHGGPIDPSWSTKPHIKKKIHIATTPTYVGHIHYTFTPDKA